MLSLCLVYFWMTLHLKVASSASVPMYYEECPGGYELTVIDSDNESTCLCETQEPRVLNCESDQDSIIIEVQLTSHTLSYVRWLTVYIEFRGILIAYGQSMQYFQSLLQFLSQFC